MMGKGDNLEGWTDAIDVGLDPHYRYLDSDKGKRKKEERRENPHTHFCVGCFSPCPPPFF